MTSAERERRAAVQGERQRERTADQRDRAADLRDQAADAREQDLDRREAVFSARAAASREQLVQAARRAHDRVEISRLAVEASQDLLRTAEGGLSRSAANVARDRTRDSREQADVDRQRRTSS